MHEQWLGLLSASALFQGIPSEDLDALLKCLQPSSADYHKDEYITRAGDKFTGIGIIVTGEALVTKEMASGNRMIMTVLKPGDMFGEIAAFAGDGAWPADVFVPNRCTAIFLPPDGITGECARMCSSHKMMILNMLRIIARKALLLNRKVEYLGMKSLRSKLSLYLLEQFQQTGGQNILLPMNRSELADFLNVSRPSLSREMCRIRDEGIIDFDKASVKIHQVEKLRNMIEPLN